MQFVDVFKDDLMFAGWPANHGAWQWGNEFLVGFMTGPYNSPSSGHKIGPPFLKPLARSLNGGESWVIERPNLEFNCTEKLKPPPSMKLSNTIIRVCGRYDTGGEDCPQEGGFYVSHNKGQRWFGPYQFKGLWPLFHNQNHNTSRTRVLGDRVFLSSALMNDWGTDWVFETKWDDDLREFVLIREVCRDVHRAVMPAVAMHHILDRRLCVMRRKGKGNNWIDVFASDSDTEWKQLSAEPIADTGWWNGNPPALASVSNIIYCAYGNRSRKTIEVIRSKDGGTTWSQPIVLRQSQKPDIGYPQFFTRTDGKLVCVYYFTHKGEPQFIEACIFDPRQL